MVAAGTRRRFTVREYLCMAEAGILHEDDRIELIEREILHKAPIGDRHAGSVIDGSHWFNSNLVGRAVVRVQNPLHLSQHSEPEPDIVLLRARPGG